MDEDGFCVVSRKKGRKKGDESSSNKAKGDHCHRSVISMKSDIDAPALLVKIKQCVNDLQISSFYSKFKETWRIAQQEISNGLPQSDISAEHNTFEELVNDTITEGKYQTLKSNLHPTQNSDTNSLSEQTESEKIFAITEDEVKRRRQAFAGTSNSSAHHVKDSITNKDESTQSDIQCEEHGQGENLESTGIKKMGALQDHSGEVQASTESMNPKNRRVMQIVCYGLGNFSSCVTARFQLALLILLNLLVSPESCFLFDPNCTDVEKQVLEELGYSLIDKNEEGKRQSSEPTLFFMPHCGKPLYNNLLWANWGQRLTNLIILGNSFNNFSERFTAKQLNEEVPYIHKIIPYHWEFSVRNSFRFTDIFNDMAFQVFPDNVLRRAPSSLWVDTAEPSYDHMSSVEIITTSSMR